MRATFVVTATVLTLLGCGEDPILKRAREAEEARAASAASGAAEAAPEPGASGGAGASGEVGAPAPAGGGGGAPGGDAADPGPGVAPDPPRGDPAVPPPGGTVGGVPGAAGSAPVAADAPDRVHAPDPPKGVPVEPKAAPPGAPGGGPPGGPNGGKPGDPGAPPPPSGPTVKLSGVVVYPTWTRGSVRVDVFDGDHTVHGTHPGVVASTSLARPGPFSVAVPQGAGKVYVEAVVDEDGDGRPGPQDPMGTAERYPVTAGDKDVTGLSVTLVKHAPPGGEGKKKGDF